MRVLAEALKSGPRREGALRLGTPRGPPLLDPPLPPLLDLPRRHRTCDWNHALPWDDAQVAFPVPGTHPHDLLGAIPAKRASRRVDVRCDRTVKADAAVSARQKDSLFFRGRAAAYPRIGTYSTQHWRRVGIGRRVRCPFGIVLGLRYRDAPLATDHLGLFFREQLEVSV